MNFSLIIAITCFLMVLLTILGFWQRKIQLFENIRLMEDIQDSQQGALGQPIAQHPQINHYRCLGCSSCVRACPEHGALSLVQGTSRLVRPSRCIGHGHCARVCPVGALTVGLGDTSSRPDIPILSEGLEASVRGVFIAGELGGIALIHHAVEQGSRVVDLIAQRLDDEGHAFESDEPVNVLIVGSGPAGIAATLAAEERGISYLLIDQNDLGGTVRKYPRGKLVMTQPVDLPLFGRMKKTEYSKEELIQLWENLFRKTGIHVRDGVKLLGLDCRADGVFMANTSEGTIHCRNVVLALGRRGTPRRLGVPGEESERVLYQLMDADSYSDQEVLVVGGGDSAVEAAVALANQPGNIVTLSYRREGFFRLKAKNRERITEYQEQGRVRIIFNSQVLRIDADSVVLRLKEGDAEGETVLGAKHIFVFAGGEPPYPLLKSMGIRFGGEEESDEVRVAG